MQDQMFATQAIKQIDEHQESDYRTITVLLLTSNLQIFPQLMSRKEMWVGGNLITGITLLIRSMVTVIASTSFTQGP